MNVFVSFRKVFAHADVCFPYTTMGIFHKIACFLTSRASIAPTSRFDNIMRVFFVFAIVSLANLSIAAKNKIGYTYTLWIGDNVDEKHFIHLKSEAGIKFIEAMDQAAAKEPSFAYEGTDSQYGKFITKIAGKSQDSTK
jgi:hypothetical protein